MAAGNDATTPHHYMMLALCFIIALPLLTMFKIIFKNYLVAPLPPEVVAFFCRFGRRIEPSADGELGVPFFSLICFFFSLSSVGKLAPRVRVSIKPAGWGLPLAPHKV